MLTGLHTIIYSPKADELRAFLQDILELPFVDAGGGWPIYAMPPAELAVHPSDESKHELYLMCTDIQEAVGQLRAKNVEVSEPENQGWGILASITLPDGSGLGIYEPRHPLPSR